MKKMVKFVMLIGFVFLCIGCNDKSKYLENISYEQFQKKVENKEDFIVIITKDQCDYCKQFHPVFQAAVQDLEYTAFEMILTDMKEEDYKSFKSTYSVNGTPTVMFFKAGEESSVLNRMVGANHSKNDVINRIKELGYTK